MNELPEVPQNVLIVRFKNNVEIVANFEMIGPDQGSSGLQVRLHNPMRFGFIQAPSGQHYLQLGQWNPLSVYKFRHVDVDVRDILYTADPSSPLLEYYQDVVHTWDEMIAANPDREFAKVKTVKDMMQDMGEHFDSEDVYPSDDEPDDSKKKMN
jgi:hypothetical protein